MSLDAYREAARMAGTREGQAALTDFLRTGGQNIDPLTRAWCADFVNASLQKAGQKGTGSGMARSFLKWGQAVTDPQEGDLAVFSRGSDPKLGHVGFYAGTNPDGSIKVLGGNQSDSVSYADYAADRLLGFRRGDPSPSSPAGGARAASEIQSPSAVPGSFAPSAPSGSPFSIDPAAASLASGQKEITPADRLGAAFKDIGQQIDNMSMPRAAAHPGGPSPQQANALLAFMNNPTVTDLLLKRRLPGALA